ncbi:BTB/POZ domain-containing protein At3g22104 isoform X5 [Herrania umbratica]|uniref:BTB/POZ domain-containing protein At3g22104 isoform X5 n=1 Tax=Herrania umbratica TaxID=108875 RepID=A0A6J1BCI4_9ROSI|nr:BTB/POZ domain-containing protein At3g22104 isoform X5 [Herrania umbratica]
MAVCCDLEVDVNGEETFLVHKKIVGSYSGRLSKLFGKSTNAKRNKVVFHDFPGGAENFELVSRFCYNEGKIDVNPSNILFLYSAAQFMEMNTSVSGTCNLLEKTKKSIEEISYWTWSDLLVALKHCQDLQPIATFSGVLEKCLDSLVGRLAITSEASPCASTSSPDSSGFRLSCDSRSTESLKNSFSRATWWFEDLSVLSPDLIGMLIELMVSRKYNHVMISRFLFHYQKSKFCTASSDEKCKVLEIVIDMLYTLDPISISCKNLFGILRVVLSLKIGKSCRNKLESMIGSQMDQATLDNLLIPSPYGSTYLYDVNLVLRFLKAFRHGGGWQLSPMRMKKVASLIDLYIAEVAPDPCLKSSKFLALLVALPDSARDSWDELYHAMDIYLEVHAGLSEEEKMKICCALNYEKLSTEACMHLSQNARFPSKNSPLNFNDIQGKAKKDEATKQVVLYSGRLDISAENEKLRAHLQRMQWRVVELEKVCKKMQTQMAKIMKSKVSSHSAARSLPRLCS